MKRFIDLGEQILEGERCFAWFNTVVDQFEEYGGVQAWQTWAEFEQDCGGDDLLRYRGLFPADWPNIEGLSEDRADVELLPDFCDIQRLAAKLERRRA